MSTEDTLYPVIKAGLQALLATAVFNVTFIKADGFLRTLKVTLDPEVLPATDPEEGKAKTVRASNDTVVTVYDLDVGQWKSFKIDSLVSISKSYT